MKIYLNDRVGYFEIEQTEQSWLVSEVNDHGDLTIYRVCEHASKEIAHFASGTWAVADHDCLQASTD